MDNTKQIAADGDTGLGPPLLLLATLFLELRANAKKLLHVTQVVGVDNAGDFFEDGLSQASVVHFLFLDLLGVYFDSTVQNIIRFSVPVLPEVAHEDTEEDREAWAVLSLAIGVHDGGVSLAFTHGFVVVVRKGIDFGLSSDLWQRCKFWRFWPRQHWTKLTETTNLPRL